MLQTYSPKNPTLTASVNYDYESFYKFDALQIPTNQYGLLMLGSERVINYAHRHNLAVQYWTINDEKDAERLIANGADCIMTDYPEMVQKIQDELKAENN